MTPDDVGAIRAVLVELHDRFSNAGLPDNVLDDDLRQRLPRRTRVEETAELLRSLG